jgi:hypothetical protein
MWRIDGVRCHKGGRLVVPRQAAPIGVRLPYRRAQGEGPAGASRLLESAAACGWSMEFVNDPEDADRSFRLGDLLLQMAAARALRDALEPVGGEAPQLLYAGPRHELMERSDLAFSACEPGTESRVCLPGSSPVRIEVRPNRPPIWRIAGRGTWSAPGSHIPPWLDLLGDDVEVHSALPMRYYLELEQELGVRLPQGEAPAPRYTSSVAQADPGHVVLVATTSAYGSRQDYGVEGLLGVARALLSADPGSNRHFTLVVNEESRAAPARSASLPVNVVLNAQATEYVDVFAASELVVGHDTGLTHLAALTIRPDGSGPQVIALHGRYSHLKWLTGSARHHSVATPTAQMMALADVGLHGNSYGRKIDDELWATSAVSDIPPGTIAEFALECLESNEGVRIFRENSSA